MKKGEKVFNWILAAMSVLFVILSVQITPLSELSVESEGFYPVLISVISLILAVTNLLQGFANEKAAKDGSDADKKELPPLGKDVVVMMGLLVLYAVLIFTVHYIIATLVFTTAATFYLSGKKDWKTSFLVGFIATMMIVLVFKYGFSVILP